MKLREIFFEEYYKNLEHPFYENAKEVLQKLKNEGHELFVLTSRPDSDKQFTFDRLNREFGEGFFSDILFTCDFGHDDKYLVANTYNFDVVIDDSERHLENYFNNSKATVFVFDRPWNKHLQDSKKMIRVKSWKEFDEHISLLKKDITTPFRELLDKINKVEGLDRIRFTSSNPHDMTKDILDAHFELPKMCNYLHFALQSGSNSMLKRMNRKHTYEDFKMQVEYLRSKDPLFAISTDIIVGFPGETEEEFQATVQAMKEIEFDFAYIARYSSRTGTLATTRYEDDISHEEKARRWDILNTILRESVQKRAKLMIGRIEPILISGKGKDETLVGRTRNFKEVYIPENENIAVGDIVNVKITELDGWVLK